LVAVCVYLFSQKDASDKILLLDGATKGMTE